MSAPLPAAPTGVRRARLRAGARDGVRFGCQVTVRAPASSANLGPGFDSMGLALALHDLVTVEAFPPEPDAASVVVEVSGEGAGSVPCDEEHLVVRSIRAGLERAGAVQPRLRVHCANAIPHGKGLGSSAAAVVAGLVAARGLLERPELLDDAAVFALATAAEGHPDNAAAAAFGGFVISWLDAPGSAGTTAGSLGVPRYIGLPVDPRVRVVLCLPEGQLPTSAARAMLPATVPHSDAAFTAARAALLVEALTRNPQLLFAATHERLHQVQRAPAMPASAALLTALRSLGAPAVVSGAGPCVLVLCPSAADVDAVRAEVLRQPGTRGRWSVLTPDVDTAGAGLLPRPA